MQKRLLLAFLLSFLFLSIWTILFPPPKPSKPAAVTVSAPETSPANEVKKTLPAVIQDKAKPTVASQAKESRIILENSKIKVEFSNIGGNIKSVIIKEFDVELPITNIIDIDDLSIAEFTVADKSDRSVVFEYQNKSNLIRKTFTILDNEYRIDVNVQTGHYKMSKLNVYTIDSSNLDQKIMHSAEKSLYEYSFGLFSQIIRKTNAVEFNSKEDKAQDAEVTWVGYRNRYFCFVYKPAYKVSKYFVKVEDKSKALVSLKPAETQEAGSDFSAKIYVGPQKLKLLGSYGENFEQLMVFSNYGILDIAAKFLYFVIHATQGFVKNWGIAIILLCLGIFFGTYPLTAKSMSSMRKMQILQPKIAAMQEKYKNDPQRMNKEVMELYKENNVNPFGGCLPMLIQMPIFFGLYQVLWRSVEFKGAGFLWIKDLSEPDRLLTMPINIPLLGNELNILPLLMAVIMYFQQKFTSRNMVVTDPNQLMQQRMMQVMVPVMMGFIFYHFASGLTLYFTGFYLLSTLMQWKMSSQKVEVV